MTALLFLFSLENHLVGNAGFWWTQDNLAVLSGEIGDRLIFSGMTELDVRVAYSDITRGNLDGFAHDIFLSRASVALGPEWMRLWMGRVSVAYGDGLFLNDIGLGSDGAIGDIQVCDLGLHPFYFIRSDSLAEGPPDRSVGGLYANYGPEWLQVQAYAGSETQGFPDRWAGTRFYLDRTGFRVKAELVANRPGNACMAEFVFWGLGVAEMGGGFFHFSEAWRAPFYYTPYLDDYYNGWSGYGDAMTWALMTDTLLPQYVSSLPGGPYGIYWPDIHSVEIVDLSLLFGVTENLSGRLDGFAFFYLPARDNIGNEVSLNLFYDLDGFRFGLGGGYLAPGEFLRDLGRNEPYWTLRLWGFREFEIAPVAATP